MLLLPLPPPLSRGQFLVFPLLLTARIRRSIIINHVHDLDLKISLMRSYWGWHIVLLNPDMSWLILWWGVRKVFFQVLPQSDCVLILRPDKRGRCQNYKAALKWLPGSVHPVKPGCVKSAGQKHDHRHPGNAMMSLVDLDVSRLQSGTPNVLVLLDCLVWEPNRRWNHKCNVIPVFICSPIQWKQALDGY